MIEKGLGGIVKVKILLRKNEVVEVVERHVLPPPGKRHSI